MTARSRNLTSAVVLMAVSAYWFVEAGGFRPLSRIFPRVVAAIVFIAALLLGILTFLGHGPVIQLAEGDAEERHMRSGTLMGAIVGWTALIPLLGLLAASAIGVVAIGFITFRGHHGTGRAIISALISVVVFYFLFQVVLYVPFPMGVFG
jgi:hypothetical protein